METKLLLRHRLLINCLAALSLICTGATALGCNIPVFRFALERWQPDSTEVVVFVRGDLSNADRQRISQLQTLAAGNGKPNAANLQVILVDLNDSTRVNLEFKAYKELWEEIETARTADSSSPGEGANQDSLNRPYVVIRTRIGKEKVVVSWKGLLEELEPDLIADSPARRELSRRILAGDSVVWVVLRSTDKEKSDRIVKDLNQRLGKLASQLQLPDGVGLPGSELYSEVPLFLQFSVLEIDATDTREWFLAQSLAGLEPRFRTESEPLVVPVFGKGRALEVMAAADVTSELTEDLTQFLCSACSCQVKELNPGFDLVMSVRWNLELFGEDVAPTMTVPERTGATNSAEPVLVPIPSGKAGRK